MPHSHAETAEVTCPHCGKPFSAEVWLLVDVAERPDLLERIRAGTLHHLTCPHCGEAVGSFDAPLLVYRPGGEPPLLFSPAQRTSAEEDEEQARGLVARLREALGEAWQEAWLAQGLPGVPRPFLPAALSEDPEAALRQMAEEAQRAMERLREEDPEAYRRLEEEARRMAEDLPLLQALQEFIAAPTWAASQAVVEAHPELLGDASDALLERLLAGAQAQGDERAVQVLGEHRDLLRRCREVGVAEAFRERVGRGVPVPPALEPLLREIAGLNRPSDMPRRVQLCQQALCAVHREESPLLWAALQGELGNSLAQSPLGDRAENLERAIHHYQQALEVYTREAFPEQWATTQNNLATAYSDRIRGDRAENLERAIHHYQQALEVYTPASWPERARGVARNLGNLFFEQERWSEATEAYQVALTAAKDLYQASLLPGSREAQLARAGDLFRRAAYAQARAGDLEGATATLEQGRARGLGEALARDRADLERVRQEDPEAHAQYQQAVARLRRVEQAEREGPPRGGRRAPSQVDLYEEARQAHEALQAAIARIRRIPGYEGFLTLPDWDDVAAAARPGVPLAYLAATPAGSLALVVHREAGRPAEVRVVWADGFTEDDLDRLLVRREGDQVTGGYLPGQLFLREWLEEALQEALPLLGERLMGPLAACLRELGATGVVLVPCGRLALLPLHAARYRVDGAEACFLDEWDVAYAPSARVLEAARREAAKRKGVPPRLVGVGNPLPSREVGTWAQGELAKVLPLLKGAIQSREAELQEEVPKLPSPLQPFARRALDLWKSLWQGTLDRLTALSQEAPDALIRAGAEFQRAAQVFAGFPDEVSSPLRALAHRIPPSLRYARAELESALDLLPPGAGKPLYEQSANREALWKEVPHATHAHLACHGTFDPEHPERSALLLACETRLTLEELLTPRVQPLENLCLAVLSACQTAVTDFRHLPDEAVGLPAGFLRAGVPTVVGSLWPVDDLSTGLLMTRFYEYHLQGDSARGLGPQPPVRALRLAQQWLRDLTYNDLHAYIGAHERLKKAQEAAGTRMAWLLISEGKALAREHILEERGEEQPFASKPYHWAPFVCWGGL